METEQTIVEYKFKPAEHWNYISEEVYDVLKNFYSEDRIKVVFDVN